MRKNQDRRIDRAMNDPRFATLVKYMEALFYSDHRFTYDEVLDAVFVAQMKYITANPTLAMIKLERESK